MNTSQTHPQQNQSSLRPGICYNQHKDSEGPLRHDARNEPAEQGKRESTLRYGPSPRCESGGQRPGTPFFQSRPLRSPLRFEWTPGPRGPAVRVGHLRKGLPGLLTHRDEGVRFAPHVHTCDFKQLPVQDPKALAASATPRRLQLS